MTERDTEAERTSHEIEDARWSFRAQLIDWLILGVMVTVTLGWSLAVYFTEPGIR
jgi:hypothetical protein